MLGFFAFIIIFILFVGLVIISTIFGFIRSIFSFGKRNNINQNKQSQDIEQPTPKSKIFDQKEGEYVDFEEIK
jgi:cell division protein YceG involved in septum cleavage